MNMTIKNIPEVIHRRLTASAKVHGRSLNKEIISILQKQILPSPSTKNDLLERIRQRRKKINIHLTQNELKKMIREGRE